MNSLDFLNSIKQQLDSIAVQIGEQIKNEMAKTPPDLPNSNSILRAHSNFSAYAVPNPGPDGWLGYSLDRWVNDPLVTDVNIDRTVSNAEKHLDAVYTEFKNNNPSAIVGTYISGMDCRKVADRRKFPTESIDYDSIPPNLFLSSYNDTTKRATIDLNNQEAMDLMVKKITTLIKNRNKQLLLMDNISHPMQNSHGPTWAITCKYLKNIKKELNNSGIRLMTNVAFLIQELNQTDIDLFKDSVDGFTLEQPFHDSIVSNPTVFGNGIGIYRQFLDAGKAIVIYPILSGTPTEEQNTKYSMFVAAMAMIIRNNNHRLFVSSPFFKPLPAWYNWPAQAGPPTGDYVYNYPTIERKFTNFNISINIKTKDVTISVN